MEGDASIEPTAPATSTPETIETTTLNSESSTSGWINSNNAMTLGFSAFLIFGTLAWFYIWLRGRKSSRKTDKRKSSKDRSIRLSSSSKISPASRGNDLSGLQKTASLASIQSTGSNYYDQLMGSGNIPKVKSISQYGALLAQQEPPP